MAVKIPVCPRSQGFSVRANSADRPGRHLRLILHCLWKPNRGFQRFPIYTPAGTGNLIHVFVRKTVSRLELLALAVFQAFILAKPRISRLFSQKLKFWESLQYQKIF
jgi:hypothetical protein